MRIRGWGGFRAKGRWARERLPERSWSPPALLCVGAWWVQRRYLGLPASPHPEMDRGGSKAGGGGGGSCLGRTHRHSHCYCTSSFQGGRHAFWQVVLTALSLRGRLPLIVSQEGNLLRKARGLANVDLLVGRHSNPIFLFQL